MIKYLDINIYLKFLKFSDFCIFTCTVHARAARLLNEFVLCTKIFLTAAQVSCAFLSCMISYLDICFEFF